MVKAKAAVLNSFENEKTKKTKYEKPGMRFLVFRQDDVIRTSFVQEEGGDTYAGDLNWSEN